MISTNEALSHVLAQVSPGAIDHVSLLEANGRVLAQDVTAARAQPPFRSSAMDGYAVKAPAPNPGDRFRVIGEAAAGHRYDGAVAEGDAVRIFTGAPLPEGADRVIIQEDVSRDENMITLGDRLDTGTNIRPAGGDFQVGSRLEAPLRLRPAHVALLASMNIATIPVYRRPEIAVVATGDELVMPGEAPREDQIIASNSFGLKARLEAAGARVRLLPIARDTLDSLTMAFKLAQGADLLITIGGASVGDHDLVAPVADSLGMERAFYKVAMRPGKPLMAGRLDRMAMVGLPGNPVSSMVCAEIFVLPMIERMLGLSSGPRHRLRGTLAAPIPKNGPREHYMRGALDEHGQIRVYERQDSSLLSVLAVADVLVVIPPHCEALPEGAPVEYIPLFPAF